jgi:hypothetical protein
MATETARPQDEGRQHRRKGAPSAATASLLARYHEAMRGDLGAVLDELTPTPIEDAGLGLDGAPLIKRPPVKDRAALWDLAIKLGRELGTEIDPGPVAEAATAPRARRRRVDMGGR